MMKHFADIEKELLCLKHLADLMAVLQLVLQSKCCVIQQIFGS